jgi:NAD(P)-dependent dehydrogenase (short-subunit alcohol dehydrogenase family)
VIDINLNGCYWMAQACGRVMQPGSVIVNVASVAAVAPGFFPSEMADQFPDGYLDRQLARLPAGRLGDPDELAAAVVFLASPAATYITATTLIVDGVLTAC